VEKIWGVGTTSFAYIAMVLGMLLEIAPNFAHIV
jgi:hypothetical protein